jgi:hypothetical protein
MKIPRILYHGSNKKINVLKPREPSYDLKENSMKAVFATSNKNLAIAMGLTAQKGSESFGSRDKLMINFVKGYPKMKYVYLHYLNSKDFRHNRGKEYISTKEVKPFKIEKYKVSELSHIWRKSNKKELTAFLKNRTKWKTPKRV